MADEHEQPEREWDEYEWEKFLQKQDLRTERYLELLEHYVDHPERDAMIAQEMGWMDASGSEEFLEESAEEELALDEMERDGLDESALAAEVHPLYRAAFDLTVWLDEALDARGEEVAAHPAAMELSRQTCLLGGKLAAALSGPEESELGMTIAYLKRALRAATFALNAYAEVHRERLLGRIRDRQLRSRLFEVRDGIVALIGENRAEWRRRHCG